MSHAKQASKRKQRSKVIKAAPVWGAAGLSLLLAGGASASTGGAADMPARHATPDHEITLGEEEISDVNLATFYVFDKENDAPQARVQLARGGGCGGGGCGCGHGGGCGGCGGRGGFGGCGGFGRGCAFGRGCGFGRGFGFGFGCGLGFGCGGCGYGGLYGYGGYCGYGGLYGYGGYCGYGGYGCGGCGYSW
jgi:hypothetical protein